MLLKSNILTVNGAESVIKTLTSFGIDTVFGYPGGVVLDLYDELFKQSSIKHVLVRHEQSAVHAAEGYARVTGKCGVVFVTSGPGATNIITGLNNAYLDGYPLIVFTGQVQKNLLGKNAFQEADICDIARSCSKAVFQVSDANDLQSTIAKAFDIAMSGKQGPVVVDITKDVFSQTVDYTDFSEISSCEAENISFTDADRIMERISNSKKPVIVVGGGVTHSKSYNQLQIFAKKFSIPVVSTMMGLGNYPKDDKNYFGMIGIFGDNSANKIIKESDLVISLGARFNDRITCMFKDMDLGTKLIQIDINKKEIGNVFYPIDYLICNVSDFLTYSINNEMNFSDWLEKSQEFKGLNVIPQKISNLPHSFEIISKIEEFTKGQNIIFTSEVGQHLLWAVKNLKFSSDRKILLSGGSGTMGFGFPAAIGACFANQNSPVVCITGDGSFQMSLQELAVCKDYNLNLKIMILNNGYLGMVRQLQQKNCDGRYYETKISNPDYVQLAKSYGIEALKVTSVDNIESALKAAFSKDNTFIIDFEVEPMEVV